MSMGPTAEPDNFPPPPPIAPSEGQIAIPGPDSSWATPAVPGPGAGVVPGMGIDHAAPANAPGPLVSPGAPQPDSPIGIDSAPPGTVHDVGNDDKMESSVAASMTTAMERLGELQSDLYGTGSMIGDAIALPDVPSDFGKFSAGSNGPLPSSENQDI